MSFMLPQQSMYYDKYQNSFVMNTEDQASICDLKMESSITKNQLSDNSKNSNIQELITQISTVESSYELMKDQYLTKINQLKQQLSRKNAQQQQLCQQLKSLYAQFQEQKRQISLLTRLLESQIKQNRKEDKKVRMSPRAITNKRQSSPKPSQAVDQNKKKLMISPEKKQEKMPMMQSKNSDLKQSSKISSSNEQKKMTTSNKMKGKVGKIGAASQKKIDIEQFVYLK